MKDLERIGEDLDVLLRRLGMPIVPDLSRLVEEWETLAGEPWATRSRPAGLRDGILVVEVDDGTAASLLKYQEQSLLERLERGLGSRFATQVRIRVSSRKKGL